MITDARKGLPAEMYRAVALRIKTLILYQIT